MEATFRVPSEVDIAAIALNGVQGAVFASAIDKERGIDVIGVVAIGIAVGVGGGLIRDLLLGAPLVVLSDNKYLLTAIVAALAGMLLAPMVNKVEFLVVALDALSLGLYLMVGTAKAVGMGVAVIPAIFVGIISCTGGALVRDVVLRTDVAMLHVGTFYVTAALGGALSYVATHPWLGNGGAAVAAITVTFVLRIASVLLKWQSPRPKSLDLRLESLKRRGQNIRLRSGRARR